MIRLADYVMRTLVRNGVTDCFIVTGGGAMHLNDAVGRCEGMSWLPNHHEQACAMAAQGYARLTSRPALVQVTTGPGGTNALTGVFGAYADSLPMIVVSGQVKRETMYTAAPLPLRQLGDQEVDIIAVARPITKYAACVTDPTTIRYHLERALHEAVRGRPGPVWIDIPVDVQALMIDEHKLEGYIVAPIHPAPLEGAALDAIVTEIAARLARAQRPVIYAGAGIRLAGAAADFAKLVERLGVPVVSSFNAHDLIPSRHALYAGRPGTIGDRAGNFTVQNADCVLAVGSRLNIRQISYNWENFARHADLIVVDVDAAELSKPTIKPSLAVHADAAGVIRGLLSAAWTGPTAAHKKWVTWCVERKLKYPVVLDEYWPRTNGVNPYCFGDALSRALADDDVIVTGDGTACIATFQSVQLRGAQRLFSDSGCAPMGFDIPAAIGACIARGRRRVTCVGGDGSVMLNIQELQTIRGHNLPVKLFVFNNNGYLSIRLTQTAFFPDNPVGAGPESGVTFPDFGKLAAGFGLPFVRISAHSELNASIRNVLEAEGPVVCEVVLDATQSFSPRVASKRLPDGTMVTAPLEDMFPFLSEEELRENMLVPLVEYAADRKKN
ncbi:MAG TPA: thiamine pyrophosphate-binding protein [Gemmatimonadaceae bacterium]|nr:thiamine pyrophosphate-binding protein [Gemmatimonadaceae bacterium]